MFNQFNPANLARNLANPEKAPKGQIQSNPGKDGTSWPSWRYGPNGEAEIFESAADVPKGWEDHPNAFNKDEGKPKFNI